MVKQYTDYISPSEYASLLKKVKNRILIAQQHAYYSANAELLRMYWDVGEMLFASKSKDGWGKKTLQRLANDLKNDYSDIKGFSIRNMQYMMQFYNEYNKELTMCKTDSIQIVQLNKNTNSTEYTIAQLPIAQLYKNTNSAEYTIAQLPAQNFNLPIVHISWTNNLILMQRVKDVKARYWYMVQCITSHWTVEFLKEAIELDYYEQHGALANNFQLTLPNLEAEEVRNSLKDPYLFDMVTFTEKYDERDVELGLVKHVEKFLMEMGAGFAFLGRQYHIEVAGDDYYLDMLMYNTFMHRYMVVELKVTEFKPEYVGKLNFYCSAVDDILCREGDNKTIGLLLCKTKDRIKAEYALRDINKPIGISDYKLGQALPKDLRSSLPSIEEIEEELESF